MQSIWDFLRRTIGDNTLGHPFFFMTAVITTVVVAGLVFSALDVALGRLSFRAAFKYLAITLPGYLAVFVLIRWIPLGGDTPPDRAPSLLAFVGGLMLCCVTGDLLSYGWHRIEHGSTFVFRHVHHVHHAVETPLTVWSGFFVHPIESAVVFSTFYIVPFALGIHPMIFGAYAALNTFVTMVTHCGYNIAGYPNWLLASTPMHEPHHAERVPVNFCVLLTLGDRLFGTYQKPLGPVSG